MTDKIAHKFDSPNNQTTGAIDQAACDAYRPGCAIHHPQDILQRRHSDAIVLPSDPKLRAYIVAPLAELPLDETMTKLRLQNAGSFEEQLKVQQEQWTHRYRNQANGDILLPKGAELNISNIFDASSSEVGADRLHVQARERAKSDAGFNVQQLANLIDGGIAQQDLKLPASLTFEQIQRSFDQGGGVEAQKVAADIDGAIKANGVGPMIRVDGNGQLSLHMVQELSAPPTAEQLRSGTYFLVGKRPFHDLVKPRALDQSVWQNAERQRTAEDNSERTGGIQSATDTVMNDPQFARNGKLSETAAREFAHQLGRHDRDMPEFMDAVNAELLRRGSNVRFTVDVIPFQPGMHGNTVIAYNIQSFDRRSGNRLQAYRDGHDTVRDLSPSSTPIFHWNQQ